MHGSSTCKDVKMRVQQQLHGLLRDRVRRKLQEEGRTVDMLQDPQGQPVTLSEEVPPQPESFEGDHMCEEMAVDLYMRVLDTDTCLTRERLLTLLRRLLRVLEQAGSPAEAQAAHETPEANIDAIVARLVGFLQGTVDRLPKD